MSDLRRILHVDDDEEILELVKLSLELVGGFDLRQFSSADRAIAQLGSVQADLVLLDVMMPGTDGPGLLRIIRQTPGFERIPAVFMTARAEASVNRTLEGDAVLGVVTKPFDPMILPSQLLRLWAARA